MIRQDHFSFFPLPCTPTYKKATVSLPGKRWFLKYYR